MRRCPPICAVLAATFASCASAPAPQSSDASAKSSAIDSADIERTRKRRLDELRGQLTASNAGVVAWAAWRVADEQIRDVGFEVRQSALAWGRREKTDRGYPGAALLDALVVLESRLRADELAPWIGVEPVQDRLIVFASRMSPPPIELLLPAFEYDSHSAADAFRCRAAGNVLVREPSPEVARALLELAEIVIRVRVVDPGPPRERLKLHRGRVAGGGARSLPNSAPHVWYEFHTAADSASAVRIPGPASIVWVRRIEGVGTRPETLDEAVAMTGRTYAADLLGWLAESGGTIASFAHPEITVEIVDPERAQREVDRVRDAARARWSSVLSALVKQGRLTDDDVAGHGDPTKLLIDDDRGYTSGVARTPLPDFGQ